MCFHPLQRGIGSGATQHGAPATPKPGVEEPLGRINTLLGEAGGLRLALLWLLGDGGVSSHVAGASGECLDQSLVVRPDPHAYARPMSAWSFKTIRTNSCGTSSLANTRAATQPSFEHLRHRLARSHLCCSTRHTDDGCHALCRSLLLSCAARSCLFLERTMGTTPDMASG